MNLCVCGRVFDEGVIMRRRVRVRAGASEGGKEGGKEGK